MKPTSPFSAQTLLSLAAKHVQSDPGYNVAKPLCGINRCAAHTAVPLPGPKQYKAESVVQRLTMCMDTKQEQYVNVGLGSFAKCEHGWGYWMKQTLKRICELQPFYSPDNTAEMKERGKLIRKDLSTEISSLQALLASKLGLYGTDFDISSSDGIGRKTEAPWVRFYSKRMSPKPTDGYYCVIHFKRDGSGCYLTLGCGSTSWNGGSLIPLKPEQLKIKTGIARQAIVDQFGDLGIFTDQIELGAKAPLPKAFERATAVAKFIEYSQIDTTDFAELLGELATFLQAVYDAQSSGFDLSEADQVQLEIEQVISPKKLKKSSQGFGLSAPEKKVVELRAMELANNWLKKNGYITKDTSATEPYDILAEKDGLKIRVEVKGTTSHDPNAILMTANEVTLHQTQKTQTALAIVSSIKLIKRATPAASGGKLEMQIGWDIDEWILTPTAFRVERK